MQSSCRKTIICADWVRRRNKGAIKQVAGKVAGHTKLESKGKADKFAGKVQNAVGGAKDALRGK
jgi:uncharacterized protein YjbJ (UPF0337 family)